MKGMDFFTAIYLDGKELPIRIFFNQLITNVYRDEALCFCDLSLDDEEDIPDNMALIAGFDVSIIADRITDRVRDLAKSAVNARPRHLVILAGDVFTSWAPHRGWK